MNIGICKTCRQSNELHEGPDGKGYCETCLVKNRMDKPLPASPEKQEQVVRKETPQPGGLITGLRDTYVDYIVSKATADWIERFLNNYMDTLRQTYGWVKILEDENNERILLRMATELGYGAKTPVRSTLDLLSETNNKVVIIDGSEKPSKRTGKGRKSIKSRRSKT